MQAKLVIRRKDTTQILSVRSGMGFQAVCAKEKTGIEFDCRAADCGICNIRILRGADKLSPPTLKEADFLKAMRAAPDERLACQVRIFGDVEIEIDYL
jgi:ferredoxin